MNVGLDELERLLKRYVSTGAAVVVVLLGAGQTSPPADGGPTADDRSATVTVAPTAAPPVPGRTPDRESTPGRSADPERTAAPGPDGADTAAQAHGWGAPARVDDFDSGTDGWQLYDGPGHAGKGRRAADAVTVRDGVLTITGDAAGTTGGMSWGEGRRYGRWEGRVRSARSDPSYHALLLLWPDAKNWPQGGEIDFMETGDPERRTTDGFIHHGADNRQVHGSVRTDATRWHHWAVEWTPSAITMFLDGRAWFRTTDRAVQPPGPMHLCVQLDWFPKGEAARGSTMEVDWVREYAVEAPDAGAPDAGGADDGNPDRRSGPDDPPGDADKPRGADDPSGEPGTEDDGTDAPATGAPTAGDGAGDDDGVGEDDGTGDDDGTGEDGEAAD